MIITAAGQRISGLIDGLDSSMEQLIPAACGHYDYQGLTVWVARLKILAKY